MAFETKGRLHEWLVMSFSLTNAPSTFIRLMNHVPKPIIGKCVIVYFDAILVCSECEELTYHPHQAPYTISYEKFFRNLEKCHFISPQVIFLGCVVLAQGIHVDKSKIKVIHEWPVSTFIQQVRSFHASLSLIVGL